MRNEILTALAGAALVVSAGHSVAGDTVGQIKRIEGSALISQGEQFVAAREGMALQELDRLMVLEDSSALVAFADCERTMAEKELLVVSGTDPCADKPANYGGVEQTAQSALETTPSWVVPTIGGAVFATVAVVGVAINASTDEQRRFFSPE